MSTTENKIFILGNGPSLRDFNFQNLNGYSTLGMNAAYRYWDRINWYPTYYCCLDTVVLESHKDEIARLIRQQEQYDIHYFFLRQKFYDLVPEFIGHPAIRILEIENQHVPILRYPRITTGSFSALWAAYLGYSQIYLLGIDMNYTEMVKGAKAGEGITLEMTETPVQNPNYFFDDYQQQGDKFNRPNPNPDSPVHEHSWLYVKEKLEDLQYQIVNCNFESELKLFPFETVEQAKIKPSTNPIKLTQEKYYPKVLVIDPTPIDSLNATGQLKATLFQQWDKNKILQLSSSDRGVAVYNGEHYLTTHVDFQQLMTLCERFDPDLIYFRPVEYLDHWYKGSLEIIIRLDRPIVTHVMDDWIELLRIQNNPKLSVYEADLQWILSRSTVALSISQAMSDAYYQRYNSSMIPIANCLLPEHWTPPEHTKNNEFTIRHMGDVQSPNKSQRSIIEIANVVERLNKETPCILEIYVSEDSVEAVNKLFDAYPHVHIHAAVPSMEAYRDLLMTADLLLVAYQFDKETIAYLQYSFANKVPECLASGTPILAYGPHELATIRYLKSLGCVSLVAQQDEAKLHDVLKQITTDADRYKEMAEVGRRLIFEQRNCEQTRWKFEQVLQYASQSQNTIRAKQLRYDNAIIIKFQLILLVAVIGLFTITQFLPVFTSVAHILIIMLFVGYIWWIYKPHIPIRHESYPQWVLRVLKIPAIALNMILTMILIGLSIFFGLFTSISTIPNLLETTLLIILMTSVATNIPRRLKLPTENPIANWKSQAKHYLNLQTSWLILGVLLLSIGLIGTINVELAFFMLFFSLLSSIVR